MSVQVPGFPGMSSQSPGGAPDRGPPPATGNRGRAPCAARWRRNVSVTVMLTRAGSVPGTGTESSAVPRLVPGGCALPGWPRASRAIPCPVAKPLSSTTLISQRECGDRAAAAASWRARAGSRGPSSRLSPARSARHCRVASGTVTSAAGRTGACGASGSSQSQPAPPGSGPPFPAPDGPAPPRPPPPGPGSPGSSGDAGGPGGCGASGGCGSGGPEGSGGAAAANAIRSAAGIPPSRSRYACACRRLVPQSGNAPDSSYARARATTLACPARASAAGRSRPDRPAVPASSRNTVTRAVRSAFFRRRSATSGATASAARHASRSACG
jgi:hypothetical protein